MPRTVTFNLSLTAIISTLAGVAGIISAILGGWWSIEAKIQEYTTASTIKVTEQIQRSTLEVVALHRDDLTVRIRILEQDILTLERQNKPVPDTMRMQLGAFKDQLEDLKDKWYR